jgi:acyl-CoA reductase-like NAD-dependent aldehyde dehydrogenase
MGAGAGYPASVRVRVLFLFLVVLAAGCGGEQEQGGDTVAGGVSIADQRLSPEKYVELADDICADTARRVLDIQQDVKNANSPDEAADLLERQLRAVRDMRDRLAALGLPEGRESVARELVTDIDDALPHLEAAIEAMRDGDETRAQESAQRYAAASMESARQVRDSGLDFEVCGSGA